MIDTQKCEQIKTLSERNLKVPFHTANESWRFTSIPLIFVSSKVTLKIQYILFNYTG